jgi:AraC-like DNA-binding protein
MGYDHEVLFLKICKLLVAMPRTTQRELSSHLGVERHTLRRMILQRTKKNFREFRRDLLLTRTEELLSAGPERTLKEIAYTLGYASPRSFNRFVKTRTGQPPSALRVSRHKLRAAPDDT